MKVALTTTEIEGISIDVFVDEAGEFSADYRGESYTATVLLSLYRALRAAVRTTRMEVPFTSAIGDEGVIRGWHASRNEFLVTWSNGEKGAISARERVFAGRLEEGKLGELRSIVLAVKQASTRMGEIRNEAVPAEEVFAEAFGENIVKTIREDQRQTQGVA